MRRFSFSFVKSSRSKKYCSVNREKEKEENSAIYPFFTFQASNYILISSLLRGSRGTDRLFQIKLKEKMTERRIVGTEPWKGMKADLLL